MTDSFETKFSILADAQINDKVPALKKHMLGFQVVASEDDNSKAVGVLAYNIGKRLVYVPIFWLNGKVKGGDVMYLKEEDRFLPLGEIWVNFINSGKSFSVGESDKPTEDQTGAASRVSTMDLNWLYSKRAGETGFIDPKDVIKMSAQISCPEISLAKHLSMFTKDAADALAKTVVKSADFANSLFRYYTPNELFNIIGGRLKTAADNSNKKKKVVFYTDKYSKSAADLTLSEKQELVKDGIVAQDFRKEASVLYKVRNANNKYATPDVSGRYDVLTATFELVPRTIILLPKDSGCRCFSCRTRNAVQPRMALVIDTENKTYAKVPSDIIMAVKKDIKDEAQQANDIRAGVAVTQSVLRDLAVKIDDPSIGYKERKAVFYSPTSQIGLFGDLDINAFGTITFKLDGCDNPRSAIITNNNGKMGFATETTIFLPQNSKVINLSDYKRSWDGEDTYSVKMGLIAPFSPESVGLEGIKVASDGIRYSITSTRTSKDSLSYVDAVKTLVMNEGLRVKQAKDILSDVKEEASNTHRYHNIDCVIKYAEDAFDRPDEYGNDHTYTKEVFSTPGLSNREITAITQAANKGVKEVLDTKILAELAKSAYPLDRTVDSLPVFMKAIDKLGRLLFLFYWHNDAFAERYGKQNLNQIEDSLKDNLQSLGDLVIYLKEKTVTADETLEMDQGDDLSKDLI